MFNRFAKGAIGLVDPQRCLQRGAGRANLETNDIASSDGWRSPLSISASQQSPPGVCAQRTLSGVHGKVTAASRHFINDRVVIATGIVLTNASSRRWINLQCSRHQVFNRRSGWIGSPLLAAAFCVISWHTVHQDVPGGANNSTVFTVLFFTFLQQFLDLIAVAMGWL